MFIDRSFVEDKISVNLCVSLLIFNDFSLRAADAPVKWPPKGTMKFFMQALIT
jgi:hypothetical protein